MFRRELIKSSILAVIPFKPMKTKLYMGDWIKITETNDNGTKTIFALLSKYHYHVKSGPHKGKWENTWRIIPDETTPEQFVAMNHYLFFLRNNKMESITIKELQEELEQTLKTSWYSWERKSYDGAARASRNEYKNVLIKCEPCESPY